MATSAAAYEKRERLAYILDMLNALSGVAARDGSGLLRYFVELAAAQARDEYAATGGGGAIDPESRTFVNLH